MTEFKTLKDINIKGKKVLIRVDMNVPMDAYRNITDDTRIKPVLPSIEYAQKKGAKVIIASHLGRPNGIEKKLSLVPVVKRLSFLLNQKVKFVKDCIGSNVEKEIEKMKESDILFLENLRFYKEEQENDDKFAKKLADLCDVYANNAFAVSHRKNASVCAITKYAPISVAGFLLEKEITFFQRTIEKPRRPLVAVLGGSKIKSKTIALKNMMKKVEKLIIGGAMANTFLKSLGYNMGKSLVENDSLEVVKDIIDEAKRKCIKLYLPVDFVAARRATENSEFKIVTNQEVPSNWMALDIGPATSLLFSEALYNAKTIIWNGPMGKFEIDAFSRGTISMVHALANAYADTIVGGGDTDVAIHKVGEANRITYISTGGGAFLSLMEGKNLPAVKCLLEAQN